MPKDDDLKEKIEIHERLARIEEALKSIREILDHQKDCDEVLDEKIDQILANDKDKLQRIATNEAKIKINRSLNVSVLLLLVGTMVKTFFFA